MHIAWTLHNSVRRELALRRPLSHGNVGFNVPFVISVQLEERSLCDHRTVNAANILLPVGPGLTLPLPPRCAARWEAAIFIIRNIICINHQDK